MALRVSPEKAHITSACYQHLSRSVCLTHLENSKHMFISAEEPAITVQFRGSLQPSTYKDGDNCQEVGLGVLHYLVWLTCYQLCKQR